MMRKLILFFTITITLQVTMAQEDSPSPKSIPTPMQDEYQNKLIGEMDKMLDLWYVKREIINSRSILSQVEDDTTISDFSDSLISSRLQKMSAIIPIKYNQRVKSMINLYISRKRSSSAMLGLAQYYYPIMEEIFDKYDVPLELIYLTIIESGLNPNAVSRAGATGIWQFMYTTGKMYGLEVNTFIDDRRDPIKATDAAARHLRDLYNMFNDWGMAISAYNCGPGNVRKAIQRSGGKTDLWSISSYLPKETQNYFPAYIGAFYLMKYHNAYGIKGASISIPTAVDTIMVKKEVHFSQIAHVLNINIEELRTLNPQYKRDVIPAFSEPYPLRLRSKDILRFISFKDSIYNYEYDQYFAPLKNYVSVFTGKPDESIKTSKKYHVVKSGESLSKIANKYGLSVNELKKMNNLKSNYIKPKMRLVVGYKDEVISTNPPATSKSDSDSIQVSSQAKEGVTQPQTQSKPKYHIVQKGETLSKIATKYKVSISALAKYNGITNVNSINVGQKIKIPQ